MKYFYRILFLFLPVLLSACEEGVFGPRQIKCLEYRQTSRSGSTENFIEREYEDGRIMQLRYFQNGNPQGYYAFTYDTEGRISESQYFNLLNNTQGVINKISYNANGKWIKALQTFSNGASRTREAEYNSQNQIIKVTESTTNAAGVVSPFSTTTYEWEGSNNTVFTYTVSTFVLVERYEFDLTQENKRRREQEKTAFLSNNVSHNKNMYRRSVISYTPTNGSTSQSSITYNYQFNEEGYPVQLTRTTTTGTATSSNQITEFEYSCD